MRQPEPSGKAIASLASLVGLALVWSVVWANLPSREELLSDQPQLRSPAVPPVPELDLTIPGVSSARTSPEPAAGVVTAAPRDSRSRQLSEMKCDAEVQEVCPEALTEEERRQCMARTLKRLSVPCRQIAQQRLARGK